MRVKDFLVPSLGIGIAIILITLVLLLPSEPQVGTAIGTQNVYPQAYFPTTFNNPTEVMYADASGLSIETKELVDDLRWKHYGYGTLYSGSDITIDWTDYYQWTMYFEDGKLFVETEDGKWFIRMEKMEGVD